MSRFLHVASAEDESGQVHEFHAFSEDDLYTQVADWCRWRWEADMGECPVDDAACVELYFDKMSGPPYVASGFEHTWTLLDPIEIPDAPCARCGHSPDEQSNKENAYNIEVYCNGSLEISLRSPDAQTDMLAIARILEFRTRMMGATTREAMNVLLYGTEHPRDMIHTDADGTRRQYKPDGSLREPAEG